MAIPAILRGKYSVLLSVNLRVRKPTFARKIDRIQDTSMNLTTTEADNPVSGSRASNAYGRIDVAIPQVVHEAGRLSTVSIIIRNPFNVTVEIVDIQGPRSSHLEDIHRGGGQQRDFHKQRNWWRSLGSYFTRFTISEVRIAGITAEFPSRKRVININAQEKSQLTIDTDLNEYDVVNVEAERDAVVNFKKPPVQMTIPEKQVMTIEPNCEAVAYFHLRTSAWLFFTPTRQSLSTQVRYRIDRREKTQVITSDFEIKPPLSAIVIGAVVGALLGTLAKFFTTVRQLEWQPLTLAMGASIVMALIASIALSRKAASQAFITVEDFFGGFVVGALIGYGGSSYFEKALIPEAVAPPHSSTPQPLK